MWHLGFYANKKNIVKLPRIWAFCYSEMLNKQEKYSNFLPQK